MSDPGEAANAVIELREEGAFVVVGSAETSEGVNDVFMMKIDCDGDTIWTRRYQVGTSAVAWDVVEAANGNDAETAAGDLIVCGQALYGPPKGGQNGFVSRCRPRSIPHRARRCNCVFNQGYAVGSLSE